MVIESAWLDNLQIHRTAYYGVPRMTLGSPSPRGVMEPRPSAHGATDSTAFYGPRSIELVGTIQAPDMAGFWPLVDELLGRLALGSEHTFRFRRLGESFDLQAVVRVDSDVDLPVGDVPKPFARWGVSLLAPDPRLYASTVTSGSYDPTDAGDGGLAFPLVFPLVFGVGAGAGALSLENEGNIAAPAEIVVTGPVTNPIIDNDTAGMSIYTRDCALASGDTLVFDTRAATLRLNGTTLRPDLIDVTRTTWWSVRPGVNVLRLRGLGMASGQTQMAVSFRSARI